MSDTPEALRLAGILDDAVEDPMIETHAEVSKALCIHAAAELRRQHELIQEMRKALDIAKQFMTCASDWNFDEAEINGEMVGTFDLIERMESVIAKAEEQR